MVSIVRVEFFVFEMFIFLESFFFFLILKYLIRCFGLKGFIFVKVLECSIVFFKDVSVWVVLEFLLFSFVFGDDKDLR